MATVCELPVYGRGSVILAYAIVDEADWLEISRHRWHLQFRWGYVYRSFRDGGRVRHQSLHRHLLGLEIGDPRQSDHINRDPLDNRRCNLRIVTCAQNQQNRGPVRGSSSRHRGVCWNRGVGKWQAAVTLDGRQHHLGVFADEESAARAAESFRRERMPYSQEATAVLA